MPDFQLLRCLVALGGDQGNQVYRDRSRPIVFPELPILQFLHGEEAVTEVFVVGTWQTTNEEVVARIRQIYGEEAVQAVFPGARPRVPLSDSSIPRCTLPIYRPKPPKPDSPDPKLRPLDQFTREAVEVLDAPDPEPEDDPTPDQIAAHNQDNDDDLGLSPGQMPRPEDLPHIVRDTRGRGSSHRRAPNTLPDVNAGGSHSPTFENEAPTR